MEPTRATRMDLLARKSQVALAVQGSTLLKGKREALLKALLELIPSLIEKHSGVYESLRQMVRSLAMTEAFDGRPYVESLSVPLHRNVDVSLDEEVFWGVRLPKMDIGRICRDPESRGVSVSGLTSRAIEAANDAEQLLQSLLTILPLRVRLNRLGEEVRKTSRRVNALDQILIPWLQNDIKIITQALEEMEREDTFRLRRIKKKKERKRDSAALERASHNGERS